jgi:branched-chain amino acid transport system substrate-binding protein
MAKSAGSNSTSEVKSPARRRFLRNLGFLGTGLVVGGAVGAGITYVIGYGSSARVPSGAREGTGRFVIGASVSTSGPTSGTVSKELDMYNTWVEMINSRGGIFAEDMGGYIPVKMVVLQDGGPPDLTTIKSNYTALVNQYKVDLLIGPFTAAPAEAASAVAVQFGVPYIDNQADEIPIFTQPGASDWIVGSLNIINYWLWNYLNVLKSQTDAKTIAFIDQGDDFSTGVNGTDPNKFGGVQFAKQLGFDVVATDTVNTSFSPNYDYTPEVQRMKSLDPDVIVYSDPTGVLEALFWAACKNAGYRPRAYHPIFGALAAFQKTAGQSLGNGISADVYWDQSFPYEGLWGKKFWQELQNRAGFTDYDWPWLSIGYSCLEIACEAVQVAGSTDKKAVMQALKTMRFTNLLGPWQAQNPLRDPFPPPPGLNAGSGMSLSRAIPVQVVNGKRVILGGTGEAQALATGTYTYPEPFSF